MDEKGKVSKAMMDAERAYYEKLSKDFTEGLQVDTTRIDGEKGIALTSVIAQYVVERLNEVFGVGGWTVKGQYQVLENGDVLYHGEMSVRFIHEYGFHTNTIYGVGQSSSSNTGDKYKGAKTDAISKMASQLGVANSVFKGLVPAEEVDSEKVRLARSRGKPAYTPKLNATTLPQNSNGTFKQNVTRKY